CSAAASSRRSASRSCGASRRSCAAGRWSPRPTRCASRSRSSATTPASSARRSSRGGWPRPVQTVRPMAVADPPTEAIRLSPPEYGACQRVLATSDWALPHVHQVARNAARLCDALRQFHGLGRAEERLLVAAALLHDVGYPSDPERHHKVSARMVRTLLGPPFAEDEVEVVALVARYHRKGCPKMRHKRFAALSPERRALVAWLGGMLRVADGLDRAHDCAVGAIAASAHDARLVLRVAPAVHTDAAAELLAENLAGAMRKRDLLERALN